MQWMCMSGCEPVVGDGLARCRRLGVSHIASPMHRSSLRRDREGCLPSGLIRDTFHPEESFMLKKRGQSWLVLLLFGVTAWFPLVAHAEPAHWNLDPEHSTIEFRVAHMIVSKTTGRFMDYTGFIDMD